MSSEADRRIVAVAPDGSRIEAYTTVVGRGPGGAFRPVEDVVAELRAEADGYGAGEYGARVYGQ